MVKPDHWQQVSQLYHAALAKDPNERGRFLAKTCEGDDALRREVESLLALEGTAEGFLTAPALEMAAKVMAEDSGGSLSGRQIGSYQILSRLGAGGMGEVYRARDAKLNRDIALKVLPELFALDLDRLGRFKREAQLLASLNHPNIAAIYGFEESGGVRGLVMELVEGEDLSQRIARGAISIDEALPIAKQIADALEAAHEQGIIHRDLKPANIKVRPDGTVKVLDFGLAKLAHPETLGNHADVTASPTLTSPAMMTGAGVILGTAAYMSPEQAKGLQADQRSDVFSFGCVLYEMLTGRRPFGGDTSAETLAAVLMREPDLDVLPPNLNPKLRDLLRRCLEKSPKRRWQAVGDLRVEIEDVLADPRGVEIKTPGSTARWKVAAAVLASAVIGATITGAAVWSLAPSAVPAKVTRFPFVLSRDQTFTRTGRHLVAISPDGANLVYVADNQLYLRRMAETEARPIPGTEQDVNSPFFSPDGQWVGFYSFQDSTLKKIAITGGVAVTLCAATNPFGVSWDGDTIVFGQSASGILAVPATGGKPEVWVKAGPGELADSPQILQGGKAVLFTVTKGTGSDRWDKADIVVQSRESGEQKVLIRGGGAARYVPTGHIVYALGANLLALPFDVERLEVTGEPIPIVEGVMRVTDPVRNTAAANFDFSADGTLAYVSSSSVAQGGAQRILALADRSGRIEPLALAPGTYDFPRLSPDGRQLAVQTNDDGGGTLWIHDLSGKASLRRLTFEGGLFPIWSPDGRHVTFASDLGGKRGIFRQAADGKGAAERLTTAAAGEDVHRPTSWSPGGDTLVFAAARNGNWSLWALLVAGERKAESLVSLPGSTQMNAEFSPDGRHFAYLSDEGKSGVEQVYVQPFPPTGAKYQISRQHSHGPLWSRDGKELFYYEVNTRKLVAITIQTQPSFSWGSPVPLPIEGTAQLNTPERQYDVSPDGRRFLVLQSTAEAATESGATQQIHLVLNWFEELKRLVPTK